MHLLEPGGRKFVELGSGSPVEEEGADAAITPETLCRSPHLKHPGHFFYLLNLPQIFPCATEDKARRAGKGEQPTEFGQ